MRSGFATLIGLLAAAIIFIFLSITIIKTFTKSYITPTESQSIEDSAQKAVEKYQQKGIKNQTPDLNLDSGN